MAKSQKIGNRFFGSCKAGCAHFKAILDRVSFDQPIYDPTDHRDLSALLQRYDAELIKHGVPSKLPAPIRHFEKRYNRNIGYSTPGFTVVCQNGFETDFSYIKAVRLKIDTPDINFSKACREAVASDALKAKREAFKRYANPKLEVQCEITGRWLKFEDAHLDHAAPFSFNALVLMFREIKGWTSQIPEHLLTESGPDDFMCRFVDPQVRDDFRDLHKRHAVLRLVSKTENLARASLARRPTIQRPVVIR